MDFWMAEQNRIHAKKAAKGCEDHEEICNQRCINKCSKSQVCNSCAGTEAFGRCVDMSFIDPVQKCVKGNCEVLQTKV